MKRTFLLLCCVVATAISSHAQRLLPRQTGIEITAGVPVIQNEKLIQPETFTANISFTRYLKAENYTFLSALYERQNLPYPIDMISFKVVDKKVVKRTAIQERVLQPLRAYNQPMRVRGNGSERMVFAFEGFSLPDDKQLEVTIHERNGGRTLSFRVQNEDLLRARRIDHLKLQWR